MGVYLSLNPSPLPFRDNQQVHLTCFVACRFIMERDFNVLRFAPLSISSDALQRLCYRLGLRHEAGWG